MRDGSIRTKVQYPLWPEENGLLHIPTHAGARVTSLPIRQPCAPKESRSQRSRRLQRVRPMGTLRSPCFFSSSLWRRLSSLITYSFSKRTAFYFRDWLSAKIADAEYQALGVREVVASAIDELDLEREAALRFLAQHTAAGSAFKSDGDIVTFCDGIRNPSQKKASAP